MLDYVSEIHATFIRHNDQIVASFDLFCELKRDLYKYDDMYAFFFNDFEILPIKYDNNPENFQRMDYKLNEQKCFNVCHFDSEIFQLEDPIIGMAEIIKRMDYWCKLREIPFTYHVTDVQGA